jgi:hypothetical protein
MDEKPAPVDRGGDPLWGYNPISRRYVKRTGSIWRRLVKSGVVDDEEVRQQLANPRTGTPRLPRPQNVVLKAEQDHVRDVISDNFDASRLTGAQLASIADQIARMGLGSGASSQRPQESRRRPKKAWRPASDEDSETDEADSLTETTAASASESDAPDRTTVARAVAERLHAPPAQSRPAAGVAIKVVRPSRRPR